MTKKEEDVVNQLLQLVSSLTKQNQQFQQSIRVELTSLQDQINKKEIPLSLEKILFQTIQQHLQTGIEKSMVGYGNPLTSLVQESLTCYNGQIKTVIQKGFQEALNNSIKYLDDEAVKEETGKALAQNIVRSILSAEKSQFDKITQEMKSDPVFRSKLTLAVDNLLEEYTKK